MQKLRPCIIPGLFLFHLVLLCVMIFTVRGSYSASAMVLAHVRQGDLAVLETPWNTFLPVGKKTKFTEFENRRDAGDVFVFPDEYRTVLSELTSRLDDLSPHSLVCSDGYKRAFHLVRENFEQLDLNREQLEDLLALEEGYDKRQFEIFDNLPNTRCEVGETDRSLFSFIHAALSADVIMVGTQQHMIRKLFDLYPDFGNPPVLVVLYHNEKYASGWHYPNLKPVSPDIAQVVSINLDTPDFDKAAAEIREALKDRTEVEFNDLPYQPSRGFEIEAGGCIWRG